MPGPIIATTDLSARSDRAVDRAFAVGRETGMPVKVVHVLKAEGHARLPAAMLERQVRDTLPENSGDAEIFMPVGSPPAVIARVAAEQGGAMIVAGVARYNQVSDYFLGTAVDYLVRHASVPVLVVKQRRRTPYRRILAPSDFSPASAGAILQAARLFPEAEILVLHAFHVGFEGWGVSDHVRGETQDKALAAMAGFLADSALAEVSPGRIEGRVVYGEPSTCVARAIDEFAADLVVLGTHGASGFRKAVIGSLASSLLSSVRPDTLMVRAV